LLASLWVEGYALVESLSLTFEPGFTVVTGETGAGKSVLIGALQLALGERADLAMVAEGRDRAQVAAEFSLPGDGALVEALAHMDLADDSGVLVLQRTISRQSGSTCRVNGRPATVSMLHELGRLLLDFHGQHEHQALLRPSRHLDFVDAFGGEPLREARARFAEVWEERRGIIERRERLAQTDREARRREDLLRHQVREIDSAELRTGEEEELLGERRLLQNAGKLTEDACQAAAYLSSDDDPAGARELLAHALRVVAELVAIDPSFGAMLEQLEEALVAVEESARALSDYAERAEFSPERLEAVERRLARLHDLKRKYGDTIEDVLTYRDASAEELRAIENAEEELAALGKLQEKAEAQLRKTAKQLTQLRRESGDRLCAEASRRLQALGMAGARLSLEHAEAESWGDMTATGADRVQFLVATAGGQSPLPLARVASGGEISRTMLALRSLSALEDAVPTVVFDEIDAGIGGKTSAIVGREMLKLTEGPRACQVICITHSAQIASLANSHIAVRKGDSGGKSVVSAERVVGETREQELARMLGGDVSQGAVAEHARALAHEGARARKRSDP
jgi:DNA repair protein RecN (Recombination protein N)